LVLVVPFAGLFEDCLLGTGYLTGKSPDWGFWRRLRDCVAYCHL
jgi:hypothetical protein